jgi:hypothetical protein
MKGRRLVMQGHYPRSSAAFLHGQAWPCFSIGECTAAHVHRISRRSIDYSFVQDAAVDLEAFFTRKDRAFIVTIHCKHSFLCSGYIGAAVHRRRLVFTCAIVNTFFCCEMCVVSSFSSSLHSLAAWFHRFVFFHTGLQVACSERGEPSDLLPVERGR